MSKSAKTDGNKLGGYLIDEIAELRSEIMAYTNRNTSQPNRWLFLTRYTS